MADFDNYDRFCRYGIFDKCNGRPPVHNREAIEESLEVAAYFDGYDNNEVRISPPIEEMKIEAETGNTVLHFVRTERIGEVEGVFSADGNLLGIWSNNDACWRQEYFGPFMAELGFKIETHWQGEWEEKLIEAAKEIWGLSDFDVELPL